MRQPKQHARISDADGSLTRGATFQQKRADGKFLEEKLKERGGGKDTVLQTFLLISLDLIYSTNPNGGKKRKKNS